MAARRPLLLIVLPVALAACGGSSSTPVSGDPLGAAVRKTLARGSEKVALSGKVDLAGQNVQVDGDGAFGRGGGNLTLRLDLPGIGTTTVDERVVGTERWLSSPLLTATLHGKHWLRLTGTKVLGIDLGALAEVTPASVLAVLDRGGELKSLGTDTLDGVSTTHYRLAPVTNDGTRYNSVDAWVDEQKLVRRVRLDLDTNAAGANKAHTVLTIDLSDFGTPVAVSPPPASEVSG